MLIFRIQFCVVLVGFLLPRLLCPFLSFYLFCFIIEMLIYIYNCTLALCLSEANPKPMLLSHCKILLLSQISEWMTNSKYIDQSPKYVAVQLDLISKVHGLEQAEKYFNKIPNTSRGLHVYGALLNCYVDAKSLDKAEAIMQKMRELGYATTLSYNVMLKLYSHKKEYEKLDALVEEMEEKGIQYNRVTLNIRLNTYATLSDIAQMEKLLMKMEADPIMTMDWSTYAAVANGYSKAGIRDKALEMLKKAEQLIKISSRRYAYEVLITLYASLGSKDDVYRIWNLHKKIGKFYNLSYLCMISSLGKLDDLDGAEKIFEEWEAKKRFFDFRLPNYLISAYCTKGLLEKAELFVRKLVESGNEPNASTWNRMALGYWTNNQMEKAVELMKKVILASQPGWKPNFAVLGSCLEYLKGNGDVDKVEEIKRLLEEKGHNSADICEKIVKYSEKRSPESQALDQIDGDDDKTLEIEVLEGMK